MVRKGEKWEEGLRERERKRESARRRHRERAREREKERKRRRRRKEIDGTQETCWREIRGGELYV